MKEGTKVDLLVVGTDLEKNLKGALDQGRQDDEVDTKLTSLF